MVAILYSMVLAIFSNLHVNYEDMPEFMQQFCHLSGFYWGLNSIFLSVYGLNRCPDGQQSEYLYQLNLLDEDQFTKQSSYGLCCAIIAKLLVLLALFVTKNPRIYQSIGDSVTRLRKMNQINHEIQLQTISSHVPQSNGNFDEVNLSYEIHDQSMTTSFRHNSLSSSSIVEMDTNEELDRKEMFKHCLDRFDFESRENVLFGRKTNSQMY